MQRHNRRAFLQTSAGALALSFTAKAKSSGEWTLPSSEQTAPALPTDKGKKPLRLGLILGTGKDADAAIAKVRDLGLPTCQLFADDFDSASALRLRQALDKYSIEATSLVVGGPGPEVYDFYRGPVTIGLVPFETRSPRIAHIKKASDFAKHCGIPAVQTHCGFIPEDPNEPRYIEIVAAIRDVASYCKNNNQYFRCETGQETPITLVRVIRDIDLDNVGVNFDLANLILYGKANPVDAIEILAPYIQGIHAKDGLWPTNPKDLGEEVPIGRGKVDFPRIIARLKEIRYSGAVTIEREISGPQQLADVRASIEFLRKLIG
ncbi:MAG TPA: sugar phosphate isomerase/epimerase family protein [Candidatus Limnocylindrales bacterium]|nr:sugar phosphate isomerase/epimerase family protein [Candidatus Limnocylindrales bacterium]